jgi:hypothetical protein
MTPIRAGGAPGEAGPVPTDRSHPAPIPPAPPPWQPRATPPWPAPSSPVAPARSGGGLGAALIVGLAAAAAGFVEISFWSSRTENGLVVECSYTNLAPWLFGPVAVACGLVALVRGRRPAHGAAPSPTRRPLALLAIAVGVLHLVTAIGGLDLLGQNPC